MSTAIMVIGLLVVVDSRDRHHALAGVALVVVGALLYAAQRGLL
jgi:hypothetical protein